MTKTNFAAGQLRSLIDRVLRLKAEQDDLSSDVSEVYKEAHSAGFDKNVMRSVVQRLRKEEKNGADRVAESDAITELYLDAYRGGFDGGAEDGEGNHPSHPAEAAQRLPEPRETASDASPRVRARRSTTSEPTSCGSGSEVGEGTAVPSSPADVPYDPMTGELDPGPMPDFLKRKRGAVAA